MSYDSRRSSGTPGSWQVAHTTPQTFHRVEHGSGTRVLPDVLHLRPLKPRIHTDLLQGYRLVHTKVCGKRLEDVRPDPLLSRGADDAESHLVDWVVGARKRLDLGHCCPVCVLVSAEGIPAGLRMPFGRHHREGLLVGVDHPDTCVHRHSTHGGADEQHLPGRDARHRRIEPALRRLELREVLLPDLHDLFCRHIRSGQGPPVVFLPELAEALQRTDLVSSLHVHVGGPCRHFGDLQPLDPLGPVSGVAGLSLVLLFRWGGCFGHGGLLLFRESASPHMESTARTASSSESWMVMIASETFHTVSLGSTLAIALRIRAHRSSVS